MATITAPILINMGIPTLAAHMFVFYFGIVADITPPVALAAYAGSAIAHSNPLKTGVQATKLAITAFIVPYIFAYSPNMLLVIGEPSVWQIIQIAATSLLGIFAVAAGLEGYMHRPTPIWQRLLLLVGGLMLISPDGMTDIIGVVIIAVIVVLQYGLHPKKKAPEAA